MSEAVHGDGRVAVKERRNPEGRVWTDDKLGRVLRTMRNDFCHYMLLISSWGYLACV